MYFDDYEFSQASSATFPLSVILNTGWNMVSPSGLHPTNQNTTTWYPQTNAPVYEYASGYNTVTTVAPGSGFWVKYPNADTLNSGDEWPAIQIVPHDPIAALAGWNLIGGYNLVDNNITTTGGNINAPIYGYNAGYYTTTTVNPGYAYWVKLDAAGFIIIDGTLSKETASSVVSFSDDWGKIRITDASQSTFTLYAVKGEGVDLNKYEMPPLPPAGMFDVRYSSGRIAEDLSSIQTIDMTSVEYPITVTVENMSVRLQDETGRLINQNINSGGQVTINNSQISKLRVTSDLIPTVYALEQNYPNPFNPTTTIEFSLPEDVNSVKLTIYNALGERVAELVNGSLTAGKYSYQWNAGYVATGMYIYELRTDSFVSIKKMVLLK